MKCRFISWAVFVAVFGLLTADSAQATHPDLQRHYRFLPRHSTLHRTHPDLEAPDIDFRVQGTFDLLIGHDREDPWVRDAAMFINVHAWAAHPHQDFVLDLDEVLNLSGLKGRQLPTASIFPVYKFEGQTASGSDVDLFASLIGPWFYLRGGTTPPEAHADFIYTIKAIARQRPWADFNDDGVVDRADLDRWTAHAGASPSVDDAMQMGDADDNHFVDGADFLTWQRQLGEVAPPAPANFDAIADAALASLASAGSATAAAIPEPGSLALLAVGACFLTARRRRCGRTVRRRRPLCAAAALAQ